MYCFLTCLGYIILGARRGGLFLWTRGVDFSNEEVKRAVGLFIGFVFAIASTACSFLYLEKMNT